MKSLQSLAPFSLVGIIGMIYTSSAMALRFLDQNYTGPDSRFSKTLKEGLAPQISLGVETDFEGFVSESQYFLVGEYAKYRLYGSL